MLFIVYWCYGTQLSVNGAAAADFWGTKNAGINYGMLFTAWGVAGLLGGRIGGKLFDKYHNYQMAFYTAAVLALVALISRVPGKASEARVADSSAPDRRVRRSCLGPNFLTGFIDRKECPHHGKRNKDG